MAAISDPAVQQALLQDPRVQAAVKQAGEQALNDPKVQQQILDTCKDKFPELASQAKDQVTRWANDPEVQAQAQQYAGVALDYAKQGAARAADEFVSLIEQGPAGVRLLAFAGGVASCVNAGMTLSGLLNPLSWVTGLVSYVIAAYQVIFALTTMLFEAPPEWIEQAPIPGLSGYQDLLLQKAKFLSEVGGRGIFYLFQGSLWLAFASMTQIVDLAVGLYLVFIALFHIAMHFGVMPQEIAQKARHGMQHGYVPLPVSVSSAEAATVATSAPSKVEDAPAAPSACRELKRQDEEEGKEAEKAEVPAASAAPGPAAVAPADEPAEREAEAATSADADRSTANNKKACCVVS